MVIGKAKATWPGGPVLIELIFFSLLTGLLLVWGIEHEVRPVTVESRLERVERLRGHHRFRQGVPLVDNSGAERVPSCQCGSSGLAQLPFVPSGPLCCVAREKRLRWYVHPSMKQLIYCQHISTAAPVQQGGQSDAAESLRIRKVLHRDHQFRRATLNTFNPLLIQLAEGAPDDVAVLEERPHD